jgi:short-subunit dehydrogenase
MRQTQRMLAGGLIGGAAYWLWRYFAPEHSTLVLGEKVVVITGASSGIGRALALAFARRGARVVLVARRREKLESVQREVEPYADAVLVIPADVTDPAQREMVINTTKETFGRVDILVNSAGVSGGGLFQEFTPDKIWQILEVNLIATMQLTRLALPIMLAQREGYIVNIGSSLARTAAPGFVPYVASKHGLAGFSDGLRRELAGTGVHILLALPVWTRTEMVPGEVQERLQMWRHPVQDADEVAEKILEALVQGKRELALGGRLVWLGLLMERYAPILGRWYWQRMVKTGWINTMRKIR